MEIFEPIERSLELPLTDIYARAEFYNESPEILTSICSMYHLSRLLVHASMVPSLSGYPLEATDSGETVQQHTDAALRQASRFAELLQQFATKDSDMTRLWHFTGYGAFVVGSLFVVRSVLGATHHSITYANLPCFRCTKIRGQALRKEQSQFLGWILKRSRLYRQYWKF